MSDGASVAPTCQAKWSTAARRRKREQMPIALSIKVNVKYGNSQAFFLLRFPFSAAIVYLAWHDRDHGTPSSQQVGVPEVEHLWHPTCQWLEYPFKHLVSKSQKWTSYYKHLNKVWFHRNTASIISTKPWKSYDKVDDSFKCISLWWVNIRNMV